MDSRQAETIASGLGALASEMRENHEAVKGAIHRLDQKVDRLDGAVAGLTERVVGLEGAVAGLTEAVAGLTEAVAGLTGVVTGLTGVVTGLTERVERLEGAVIGQADAHEYMVVDFGNGYLGSCAACLWQSAAREKARIHEQFQAYHARLFGDAWPTR